MAKPAASGVFLAYYEASQLPWMYLLTAATAGAVSHLYSRAMLRYTFLRVNLGTLAICLISLLAWAILEPLPALGRSVAIGLYTWVGVFGVLAASQFWMLANLVFDVRQAKRLFGLIGAGAISGGIVGGFLASFLAETFGVSGLLTGASLLLLLCLPISWYVWRYYVTSSKKIIPQRVGETDQASPVELILGSRYLKLLCGIIALSVVTAKLVEFQFSSFAAATLQGAKALTSFFGFWFSIFNVIGLTLQLFFTHRLFRRFGVGNTLSILPAGLILGGILMFFHPSLPLATFSRLVDGGLKQSLHRVGVEMLFVPISDAVKSRVKTYLDVLVDTVAGGFGGLFLLLLINGFNLPLTQLSVFIFLFSLAWLICVRLMRSEYLNAFREDLRRFLPNEKPARPVTSHRKMLRGLLTILNQSTRENGEKQLLFALGREEIVGLKEFKRPLLRLLRHSSPCVRAGSLRCLSNWPPRKIRLRVDHFLADPNPEVQTAALEYLIGHDPQSYEVQIRERLWTADPESSGNLLLKLLTETRNNPRMRARWQLEDYFEQQASALKDYPPQLQDAWTEVLLKASIFLQFPAGDALIAASLNTNRPTVVIAAIRAAGATLNSRWVPPLIGLLSEAPYRQLVKRVLLEYGDDLIDISEKLLVQSTLELADIRHLPALLKAGQSAKTASFLLDLVEKYHPGDLVLRKETYRALNTLKRNIPALKLPTKRIDKLIFQEVARFQLTEEAGRLQREFSTEEVEPIRAARAGLIDLLARRQRGSLSRLFRLLGLKYAANDIIPIYRALASQASSHRASALELLDNILHPPLKKAIIPVLDRAFKQKGQESRTLLALESAQKAFFEQLLAGDDLRLKLAVIYLIGRLGVSSYSPLLAEQLKSTDRRVVNQARMALERCSNSLR